MGSRSLLGQKTRIELYFFLSFLKMLKILFFVTFFICCCEIKAQDLDWSGGQIGGSSQTGGGQIGGSSQNGGGQIGGSSQNGGGQIGGSSRTEGGQIGGSSQTGRVGGSNTS